MIAASASNDSLWVRLPGATTQVATHATAIGWVQWTSVATGSSWRWDSVESAQSTPTAGQMVQFTMPAGTYTLQVAYREVGLLLDAIVIMDKLTD